MSNWGNEFNQKQKTEDLLKKLSKAKISEKSAQPSATQANNPYAGDFSSFQVEAAAAQASVSATVVTPQRAAAVSGWGREAVDDGWGGGSESTPSEQGDATQEKGINKEELALMNKMIHKHLVDVKSDLEVLQKDPNSPLYSVKSFEALNLKPEILRGVYDMGFNAPSKIQESALPLLLGEKPQNMIAQSQSGTGKTAAFVLTMLSRVNVTQPYTQCLCLSPTYELALQTGQVIEQMGKHLRGLKLGYAVRGGERVSRGKKLDYHIIIGTPGTLLDWCIKFKVIDLMRIKVFVLDEADVMIATQGHQDQSIRIQKGLDQQHVQMLLFSATYDDEVIRFAQSIISNPVVITLRREEESLDNISQYYLECRDQQDKFDALSNIYGSISIGQGMIFCRTRVTATWLSEQLTKEGHAVALLSGDMSVEQRAAVINRFRQGKEKVLITTNVSARGIDVEQVTVVVNFDLPTTPDRRADCETYLHRIGRTGRFGKKGIALNMISDSASRDVLREIERHFGRKVMKLNHHDMDEVEKIEQIGGGQSALGN